MRPFLIDIHVHPGLKPYGKSFSVQRGTNSPDPTKEHSIWRKDHPNDLERLLERSLGLVKFTQSDFQSLTSGHVHCICASLYSIEQGLVKLKTGSGWLTDTLTNFISGLGKDRINFLQTNKDYFSDLEGEYRFYNELHHRTVWIKGIARKYILLKNFAELETAIASDRHADGFHNIFVILTIEGMHNLDSRMDLADGDEDQFLANVDKLKSWTYPPFFVTFAHHFYNKLCGHAESLVDMIQDQLTRQEFQMNTGFTPLGWKVLEKLLDHSDGRRIHIDIKHMSRLSRKQYFEYLQNSRGQELATGQLPVIVSHGACNGLKSESEKIHSPGLEDTGRHMYDKDINFYDDEILFVARSGGIFGLQLDERRIASKNYKRGSRLRSLFASKFKRQLANSRMVWNNIQHMAILLDQHDLPAWDCISIGSDYDGLIDSVNLFWSAEDLPTLAKCLEIKAEEWLSGGKYDFKNPANRITATEIMDKIFYSNAMDFFRKYFNGSVEI